MKIAMIGLRGVPATYGGVERAVEELGAELVALGHDVTVFCRRGYGPTEEPHHRGMTLQHLWAPQHRGLEALAHSGLAAARALGSRFDVVHFHALGPGLFSPLSRAFSGAAVVQTIHGMDNRRAKWGRVGQRLLDGGAWVSSRVPHATIVVSEALADIYQQEYDRPTFVIPNGVRRPTPTNDVDALADMGLEAGGYLLWVGRFVPEKRPELLLEAFRAVEGQCRLVLVGGSSHTDDYTEQLRRLAAADPRITLAGFRYGRDLEQLFSHAQGFVMSSDLEGLPLTLLEAVSYQLPIVASDIAPHWEVLGQPGPGRRSFTAGDRASLAAALRTVTADPGGERRAVTQWCDDVLARYEWPAVARRTEAVYRQALDGRAPTVDGRVSDSSGDTLTH